MFDDVETIDGLALRDGEQVAAYELGARDHVLRGTAHAIADDGRAPQLEAHAPSAGAAEGGDEVEHCLMGERREAHLAIDLAKKRAELGAATLPPPHEHGGAAEGAQPTGAAGDERG
eukprot:723228-Prymnesium_polylepis.1